MKNRPSLKSGFILVEIMIVVTIIGLLAAITIPNFVRATHNRRGTPVSKTCARLTVRCNNGR